MCDFFSAIIRRDGAIFHLPSNSHSGIVDHYKLTENDTIAEMRGKARFYEFEWNGLGPVPKIESLLRGDNPPKAVTDAAKVLAGNLSRAMAEPGWGLLDDGFFAGEEYADLRWKALISENLDHRIADRLAVLSLHAQGESVKSIHSLVTKIDGNLVIAEDASLTVPALTSVGGSVYVSENASLTVPALTSVGGYVDVRANASLTVPALTSVGGSVYVSENASLTVPALTSVGGSVDVHSKAKKAEMPKKFLKR